MIYCICQKILYKVKTCLTVAEMERSNSLYIYKIHNIDGNDEIEQLKKLITKKILGETACMVDIVAMKIKICKKKI